MVRTRRCPEDSKTTLEIYAQVQKRMSRRPVKRAFEELLAGAETSAPELPTGPREKMSDQRLSPAELEGLIAE